MYAYKVLLTSLMLSTCAHIRIAIASRDMPLLQTQFASSSAVQEADFYIQQFVNISHFQSSSIVGNSLQLTSGPNSSGRVIYPNPVKLTHILKGLNGTVTIGCPFSTEFVFSITPPPPVASKQGVNATQQDVQVDGMAFLIVSKRYARGVHNSMGPFLGLLNSTANGRSDSHTFAVEFDTFQNSEFKDMNSNHVGVNLNSLVSLKAANVGPDIDLKGGQKMHAWIDYSDYSKEVEVRIRTLDGSYQMHKPQEPILSVSVDLSSVLEEEMYVGFSAGSGPSSGVRYNVYSWSFSNHGESAALLDGIETSRNPGFLRRRFIIPIGTIIAALLMATLGAIVRRVLVMRRRNGDVLIQVGSFHLNEDGPQKFSYRALSKATRGFHKQQLLGKGGFGSVYKGALPRSNTPVAVKRISKESNQGSKEFLAEVCIIGRLRHRNLVPLIGWCNHKELLLVYELMPHGSLDKLIFNNHPRRVLPLFLRTKILTGVAAALVYLHDECEQKIVHRDVKASNVMLDADYNARLGDFGLARVYDHNLVQEPEETNIAGTWGYLAPDFCITRKASDKTDVYSFGILTLEVVCGRRVSEVIGESHSSLLEWLRQLNMKGRLLDAVDARLEDHGFDAQQAGQLLQLGLVCSHPDPAFRPSMRRVLHALRGDAPLSLFPTTYNHAAATHLQSPPSS